MLEKEQLKAMYPLIVTPSHDGKFFFNYVNSLLNFYQQALANGLPVQFLLMQGESLITRARNNCVAQFLANPEWTHLVWIDSDIGFQPEAIFRLLLSDYDIAAGVYPLKTDHWPEDGLPEGMTAQQFSNMYQRYTVNARNKDNAEKLEFNIQEDGFLELSEAPTGMMCIKRDVFLRMMAQYPELQYVPDSLGLVDQGLHYRFFDVMVDPDTKRYLSEDYYFCRLWENMGGKVYVDALSNLTHQGTKVYSGNFAQSLQTNFALAIPAPVGTPLQLNGLDHLQKLLESK